MTPNERSIDSDPLFSRRQFWKTVLEGILIVLGSAGTVLATAEKGIREHTLANGFKIVLVEDHWHPLVALEVCYRVGARDDPAGKQGLAHLLEHLTYRSSGSPRAEEDTLAGIQGRAHATTNHDTTCYSSILLRAGIEQSLAVEAARMTALNVGADDLAHEKAIVMKERYQLVEGDTWRNLLEEIDGVAFRLHPYRFPTIGWPETVRQISLEDIERHFAAYYSSANAVLVAVGDFQSQELLALIETTFGKIPVRPLPALPIFVEPAQRGERRLLLAPHAAPRLASAYHVPAFGSPDTTALEVLSALLAGGIHTRLPVLLYSEQLAEAMGVEYSPLTQDPGLFYIKVALGPRVNFRLTEEAIDDVLWHLREEDLRPGELQQAKKRLLLGSYLNRSLRTRAERLAQYGALAALPHAQRYTDTLRAVTAADVQRVVRTYFAPDNRVVGITGAAHQEGAREHQGEEP